MQIWMTDHQIGEQQQADLVVPDPLQRALESPDLEDGLRPEGVRPGLDLAVEAVELGLEVVRRRVDRDAEEERRRRVDRLAVEVLAGIQARDHLREPDRIDLVDAA